MGDSIIALPEIMVKVKVTEAPLGLSGRTTSHRQPQGAAPTTLNLLSLHHGIPINK